MTYEEANSLVERVVDQLGEHFDVSQVLVTWHDGGVTHHLCQGSGNWYARIGMAYEMVARNMARAAAEQQEHEQEEL